MIEGDADECDWPGEKAGGPFNSDEPYIQQEVALPRGACTYRWAIYDAWGDGNCCAFGEGWYKLRIDGEVVMEGGEFEGSRCTLFSSAPAPTLSPTVAALPAPTVRPTPRPIPAPSLRPTARPIPAPTPRPTVSGGNPTDRETDPGADAKTDGVRRQPHRPADPCADAETDSEFDDGRADAPDDAAHFATDRRPELRADRQDDLCAVGRPRPARRHAAREPPGDEQRDAAALAV